MKRGSTDVAFTPAVKAVQIARGSRRAYARLDAQGFADAITPELATYLSGIDTAVLATASVDGQPYVQHRGGAPGFLHVLDEHTIGFVDFIGNRQYVTTGNLSENPRVCLLAIDYATRMRVKIWGIARVVPASEPAALAIPRPPDARIEHAILIDVTAWDANCPSHIPRKLNAPLDVLVVDNDNLRRGPPPTREVDNVSNEQVLVTAAAGAGATPRRRSR